MHNVGKRHRRRQDPAGGREIGGELLDVAVQGCVYWDGDAQVCRLAVELRKAALDELHRIHVLLQLLDLRLRQDARQLRVLLGTPSNDSEPVMTQPLAFSGRLVLAWVRASAPNEELFPWV